MSNIKHPQGELRTQARAAKKRLLRNEYNVCCGLMSPPNNLTPREREIYIRLCHMHEKGEEVDNPIQQFADEQLLIDMPHDEKQRYIIQLSADYIKMKNLFDSNLRKLSQESAAAATAEVEAEAAAEIDGRFIATKQFNSNINYDYFHKQ